MKYVGIRNSGFKSYMVKNAVELGKKITINLPCITADDCNRHFEILNLIEGIKPNFEDSDYYKFNCKNGKTHKSVMAKINRFKRLYNSINKNGYDYSKGYIILSSDGCRLDGSHRATIVEYLKYKEINVIMVNWTQCFNESALKDLRKHIAAQKRKYNAF